ncbi:GGDEF domain-containing protein [Halomonas sp. HMF6819]|uniref:GGDEF domain-containing protein n=1 Tax=Halomonas sp. HMF6819 TaxID=3373085 RepID=UPI0037B85E92
MPALFERHIDPVLGIAEADFVYRLTSYYKALSQRAGDLTVRDHYDNYRHDERLRSLKLVTVWLAFFYFSYTLVDIYLLTDVTWRSILLRGLLVGPTTVALMLYYDRPGSIRLKELAGTCQACLGCVAWCLVIVGSSDPSVLDYFYAGLVFILVLTIVFTPPFEYSVYGSLFVFACLYSTVWFLEGVTTQYVVRNLSVGVPVLVLSLMANYRFSSESLRLYMENLHVERLRGELTERNVELERLSHLDPLTGLANRRALARQEKKLAQRGASLEKATVIVVDVDHFKDYNDHYGHGEGDSALREVADAIKSACAPKDVVCRYGGEEFLVLRYGEASCHDNALAVAEHIRERVAERRIPHRGVPADKVTVSVGVCSGMLGSGTTLKELTRCADQALYDAKQQGRNRVCRREYSTQPSPHHAH